MMLTDLGLRADIALSTHALSRRHLFRAAIIAIGLSFASAQVGPVYAADQQKWAASWTASAHGPFPSGNAVAQPDLSFAFPTPQANDQTFRLIVRPNLWSKQFRLRFSNVFGAQPVTFDDVFLGLQRSAGAIVADSNRLVQFGGQRSVTVAPGTFVYSDPIRLEYVDDEEKFYLDGRKLAVSFHVVGTSGPMTWHAKALQTSYVTLPGAGSHSEDESDQAFPNSTTSWYFLDVVDAMAPADTAVIVAFGDSITDGTASTLNGDDRWPDVVSRRMHAAYGNHVSVVNEGIGGNQVVGPAVYSPQMPVSGGPSAISRLDRDVLSLSGVSGVIWLEGINDLGAGTLADSVTGGIKQVVGTLHHRGIKVIQATITSSVGNTGADGNPSVNAARQVINSFIRTAGIFDGVADFDAVTVDPATGAIKAQFLVNSTLGTIDHLHPNRAGYLAMGNAVDIGIFAPRHIAKR